MADLEGPVSEQKDAEQVFKSEFLEKFVEVPVVKCVFIDIYNQVKGFNKLTTAALNAAEKAARGLAVSAKPYFKNIEPTAQAIDKALCESLISVQEKYPYIMKDPDEFDEIFVEKANQVMDMTEDLVDKYLPAFKENSKKVPTDSKETPANSKETSADFKETPIVSKEIPIDPKDSPTDSKDMPLDSKESDSNVFERACKLNRKICYHIFCNGIKKIMLLQILAEEFKSQWPQKLELITQFRESLFNKTIQESGDAACKMWEEIIKDLSEPSEGIKNFQQRLPSLTFETAYMEVLETGKRHALELFTQIVQASNSSEMLINWLHSAKQKLSSLEELVRNMEIEN